MEKSNRTDWLIRNRPHWIPTEDDKAKLLEAFPDIDPMHEPFGDRVLFQLMPPKEVTKGGIIIPIESKEVEQWRQQTALVIALGPTVFKFHQDLTPWPEDDWFAVGDFVRVPMYGAERWVIEKNGKKAIFVIRRAHEVIAKITGNPLEIAAYV